MFGTGGGVFLCAATDETVSIENYGVPMMSQLSRRPKPAQPVMRRAMLAVFIIFSVAVASLAVVDGAAAQSRRQQDMEKKIEAIEKQLRAVQRKVFPGGELARDGTVQGSPGPAAPNAGQSRGLLADMEIRIARIETQMRLLTGRIEEVQHSQDQMERRFTNFREDTELRFEDMAGAREVVVTGSRIARNTPSGGLVRTTTPAEAEAVLADGAGVVASAALPAAKVALPEGPPDQQYEFARSLLTRGDYDNAELAFLAFLESHADHPLAGNAQYWLGEAYYVRRDFPRAAAAFLAGYRNYGDGSKGPDSLVKLGMALASMGQTSEACDIYYEMEAAYPEVRATIDRTVASEKARLGC